MKKLIRTRLTLNRETLRRLNPEQMEQIVGGGPTTACTTTNFCTETCSDSCTGC